MAYRDAAVATTEAFPVTAGVPLDSHDFLPQSKATGEPQIMVNRFNRNPYNGLLQSPYNWVVFHPLYTLNNRLLRGSGYLVTGYM